MDVLKEIIAKSAVGPMDKGFKTLIISIFISIVCVLFGMFVALLRYGPEINIQFGY